jgi:sugar phosphate isomerase/epimerase
MRDFSADHRWLSLNAATVRKQGDLAQIIDACARHGIRAIDPWRDQVAAIGLDRAVRAVRDAGLELSGYCRGGMFTSDAAHRIEVRDDNRRAVDEARRALHRAGGRRIAGLRPRLPGTSRRARRSTTRSPR